MEGNVVCGGLEHGLGAQPGAQTPTSLCQSVLGQCPDHPCLLNYKKDSQPINGKHLVSTWLRVKHSVINQEPYQLVKPCVQLLSYIISVNSQ